MLTDLTRHPLLARLTALLPGLAGNATFWLVGGSVRDALLGRDSVDFDIAADCDPTPVARTLATVCGGHWFWLDQPRCQSRVVTSAGTCDFAPWRAPTLAGDLAARDFTVNALALDLTCPLCADRLVDPLGGAKDLAQRTLRQAGPGVLLDDPLRVLKGARHVAQLGMSIEPETLEAMRVAARELPRVAPERLRCEMWRIIAADGARRGLDALRDCGAGEVLFGVGFASALPAMHGTLERCAMVLSLLQELSPQVDVLLAAAVEQHLDRAGLLRWWSVLGTVDRELPLRLAREWRFSRVAIARLGALGRLRPELWDELLAVPRRPRPLALWALQKGSDPVDLLIALALCTASPPEASARQLAPMLTLLAELDAPYRVPHLIDGAWLADKLGLAGEDIGAAQHALQCAEIAGEVDGVEEARVFLCRELGKRKCGEKD